MTAGSSTGSPANTSAIINRGRDIVRWNLPKRKSTKEKKNRKKPMAWVSSLQSRKSCVPSIRF